VKVFDRQIVGKLKIRVSQEPKNQKTKKPEPKGPDPNFAGQFWGTKTLRIQKIFAPINSP